MNVPRILTLVIINMCNAIRCTQTCEKILTGKAKPVPKISKSTEYRLPIITHKYKGKGITVYININISMHIAKSLAGLSTGDLLTEAKDSKHIDKEIRMDTGSVYFLYNGDLVNTNIMMQKIVKRKNITPSGNASF
uniref:Putative secreted protein n=1 Tax=Panstrongylus lignarius TaxID=156445 RepID=A0A224Y126_9HEMI